MLIQNHYFSYVSISFHKGTRDRAGGWVPQTSDHNQWLQFYLGNDTQVTGISTQGHHFEPLWVKSYSLRYSNDGSNFEEYHPGSHKVIELALPLPTIRT